MVVCSADSARHITCQTAGKPNIGCHLHETANLTLVETQHNSCSGMVHWFGARRLVHARVPLLLRSVTTCAHCCAGLMGQ